MYISCWNQRRRTIRVTSSPSGARVNSTRTAPSLTMSTSAICDGSTMDAYRLRTWISENLRLARSRASTSRMVVSVNGAPIVTAAIVSTSAVGTTWLPCTRMSAMTSGAACAAAAAGTSISRMASTARRRCRIYLILAVARASL